MSELRAILLGGRFSVSSTLDGRFVTTWQYGIIIPKALNPALRGLTSLQDLNIKLNVPQNILLTARLDHRRPKYGNVQQTVLLTIKATTVLTNANYVAYRRQFKARLFRALDERLKALQSQ